MATLLPLGVGLGLKALGGLFGNKKKKQQEEAAYKNAAAQTDYQNKLGAQKFTEDEKRRRQRGAFYLGIAKAYGLDKLLPPDIADFIGGQDRQYVNAPVAQPTGAGQTSVLGDALGEAGSYFMPKFSPSALSALGNVSPPLPGSDSASPFSGYGDDLGYFGK